MEKILFQTQLDLSIQFQTEEVRLAYIDEITVQFRRQMETLLGHHLVKMENKEKLVRYFRLFANISTRFYGPVRVKYDFECNRVIYGVKTDYLCISIETASEWREIIGSQDLEISAENDEFWVEVTLIGLL